MLTKVILNFLKINFQCDEFNQFPAVIIDWYFNNRKQSTIYEKKTPNKKKT